MKTRKLLFSLTLCLGICLTGFARSNSATPFRVGAAKVDMTPSENALPQGFSRIIDRLFCRVVVIENGETGAALISVDWGMVSEGTYDKWTKKIEETTGIPAKNIFVSPSHTHAAPFGEVLENAEAAVIEAVKKAKANLQPARISYSTGLCYLNINRDVIDPVTRLWSQGPNYDGPSDKTVSVIKFENMQGEPIAVYYNYAMHANTMYMGGAISADFPGKASEYVEEYYDNKLVALFSSGAAGDQNPISVRPMYDAGRKRGGDAGAEKVLARQAQMIASLGQILGEEVLRVMELPQKADSEIRIYASQQTVTCPGRERTNTGREGAPGTYVDGAPVNIKISLLRLGNIALTGVNAELYDVIGERIKKESPLNNTIVATITNGAANSGYIPSDDAFQRYTFQVLSSRLKPNCAETQIINGLTGMIETSEQ
jgi:hypothetical protein